MPLAKRILLAGMSAIGDPRSFSGLAGKVRCWENRTLLLTAGNGES